MWCEAWTLDETGFDADLELPSEDLIPARVKTEDDAEGPLEDPGAFEDALLELPPAAGAMGGDEALGPLEADDDAALAPFLLEEAPARAEATGGGDLLGPLLDDEAELALPDDEETTSQMTFGDEEGVSLDEAAFDFPPLPPLGAEDGDALLDEALFDEALFDEPLDEPELEEPEPPPAVPHRGVWAPPENLPSRSPSR
jgi:hypothetical protein